ncbi:MAG: tRNA (N(6)-L-threonylcarbamoyladenosine(37)-C(2))-methylthiotransferase MtaB [Fimbriimonadaceae bacterium]
MATAAFTTLGCKVNQYETQRILESFEESGFEVVPFDQVADVYVVNTCSVTSIAESKSRYTVRRANRQNPDAKVVVTGCAAQMAANRSEAIPGAHLVVPNPEKLDTLRYLLEAFPGLRPPVRSTRPRHPDLHTRTRATLKIQDGCSVLCSYCSIPYTRPKMVSRPVGEVVAEAEKLVDMGYRELVLTGVLIGAYGPETGSGGPGFEDLVERLAGLPGLGRLRISSIEMPQVSPRLVELMRAGKVVPHLHIPLQSGDDGVLAEMNRRYTQADYLRLIDDLYKKVPDFLPTTDIMVGFPTETAERFASTLHVCREARFLKAHVFRFSPRHGTPADRWGDPIPLEEKNRRSASVTEIARKTGAEHARRYLGRTVRVLVEGKIDRDGLLGGLTDNYLEVRFAGPTSVRRTMVWVRVEDERSGVLYGERVGSPSATGTSLPIAGGRD